MVDLGTLVQETLVSLGTALGCATGKMSVEKAKELLERIGDRNPDIESHVDFDEIAQQIAQRSGPVGGEAYTRDTLARWLEIPMPDLASMPTDSVDLVALYHHVKLETEFAAWLKDWGYRVHTGHIIAGAGRVEYVADVYGILKTLHQEFEVCVSFVSDEPPNEYRVAALLGQIEAYAEHRRSSFALGDVFMLVTQSEFTEGAMNAINLQNEQEDYRVIALEGKDIYTLEHQQTKEARLEELIDQVNQARDAARAAKGSGQ